MKPFTSKHCMQYLTKSSPFRQEEPKRIKKEETSSFTGKKSDVYIRGIRDGEKGRAVSITDNSDGTSTKGVTKVDNKGNTTKKKFKTISKERANRIRKRKDKTHTKV